MPDGIESNRELAKRLNVSPSTIMRRRDRLRDVIEIQYNLDVTRFGWRRIEFLIAVQDGHQNNIARELLAMPEVTNVRKHIGQHTIDLTTEIVVRDNNQLLEMLERVKGLSGIKELMWSEVVKVVGKKISVPLHVIDEL